MGEPLGLGLAQMTGFHIKRYLPAGRLVHVLADVRLQVALTEITVDVLLQNADTVLLCATGGGPDERPLGL